jgi:hypothetical protein
VKHPYAENRPFAIGGSIGFTDAVSRPAAGRGPSSGMPIGAVFAWAPFVPQPNEDATALSGIELRGIVTSQVLGPKALAIAVGGRYALPILPQYRLYAGPEIMVGTHVAVGAEKTARFLAQGAGFVALGLGEMVQVEAAGEAAAAAGGSGTLVLLGATGRVLLRF